MGVIVSNAKRRKPAKPGFLTRLVGLLEPPFYDMGFNEIGMFFEIIPCRLREVARDEELPQLRGAHSISERRRSSLIKDTIVYKLEDDATRDITVLCSRIADYVGADNIFLFLCQSCEPHFELPADKEIIDRLENALNASYSKEARRRYERQPKPNAVILLKIEDSDFLKYAWRKEDDSGTGNEDRTYITWREFQKINDRCDPVWHFYSSPNTQLSELAENEKR